MVTFKAQSGDEKSALLALTVSQKMVAVMELVLLNSCCVVATLSLWWQVLEACVKNCGQRFHAELGKFRFLNEIIRMLSPKVCACVNTVATGYSAVEGYTIYTCVHVQ